MNIFKEFEGVVRAAVDSLAAEGALPKGLDLSRVTVEPPREASHGDLATNAAMVLARSAGLAPRALAERLVPKFAARPEVVSAEVAGPGFINLRLADAFWQAQVPVILKAGESYGASDLGRGEKVNVEYVSANPTGPLHVGHGRGTVFGDALAALLERMGYSVTREYYVNDAGAQVDLLARSVYLRYLEALGEDVGEVPDGLYPGEYLIPVGEAIAQTDGAEWLEAVEEDWLTEFRERAIGHMMDLIREDLGSLGVHHAVFSSELRLIEAGKVAHAFDLLERRGFLYTGVLEAPKGKAPPDDWEPRAQLLFRAAQFGDDTDRPLRKSDGSWTYFAADIAYHLDKYERGFRTMIDVWGADHGGYVKRMKAAVAALTDGQAELDIKICQLVNLLEGGEPVKMSKRAGRFVTLREVVDAVGKDVVRFIMLTRKNDAPLDFDLVKVLEQSKENPVFYVQYAHARVCSVLRHVADDMPTLDCAPESLRRAPVDRLADSSELALIRALAAWPRTLEGAALAHEPHRIAFYLYDLASAFHLLWNRGKEDRALRFIVTHDPPLTTARVALISAVATVIASGLRLMGVEPVEEMR